MIKRFLYHPADPTRCLIFLDVYRTCLVQTMTDGIVVFVFLPESCVSVLFVLAFAAAWLQGELDLSYGIVVMDRTIALILPRPLQVK